MTLRKKVTFAVLCILFTTVFAAEFEIVPDTVGIGLQKNVDIADFESSDSERCVLYHLGNPWSTNVTGWLDMSGELSEYFVRNNPTEVFVPSGTFRYNSSCCLIPIRGCFIFPYTLEKTKFEGKVFSAFRKGSVDSVGGTGSATGSSVAYSLTININPPKTIVLNAGQKKCFEFYEVGEKCFSAPLIVLSDKLVELDVEGHMITFVYKNNLFLILGIFALLIIVGLKFNKLQKLIKK